MEIVKVPTAKLNPAPYNPRLDLKPGDKDYEKLKKSILTLLFRFPKENLLKQKMGLVEKCRNMV